MNNIICVANYLTYKSVGKYFHGGNQLTKLLNQTTSQFDNYKNGLNFHVSKTSKSWLPRSCKGQKN